ncbi:AEC family transporter [uncultured Robinsoniella sp.]|uniref:AEC family transporter n=1 Tax=uncultured Robinsoniella sp. TaxID=904190 RepID=UPI00374FB1DC
MEFLLKPLAFLLIIFGGYLLKRFGFFKETDYPLITKIVLNITLPAAVINGFGGFQRDTSLFLIIVLGFMCSLLPLVITFLLSKNMAKERRVFTMINSSGYNIGCFALPVVQSFFGPAGTVVTCLFDTGNSMIMTGGSYAMTSSLLHTNPGEKTSVASIIKKLASSIPFDTYMLMLLLAIFNIRIPEGVITFVSPFASANSFLAMLMLGLMFKPVSNKLYIKDTILVVVIRLLFSTCFSLFLYRCTPFSLEIRQILAVVAFAPIGSLAPAFTEKCHGDGSLSSFANSISVIVSLIIMTGLVVAMGITG